jgi:hypothetical protein
LRETAWISGALDFPCGKLFFDEIFRFVLSQSTGEPC